MKEERWRAGGGAEAESEGGGRETRKTGRVWEDVGQGKQVEGSVGGGGGSGGQCGRTWVRDKGGRGGGQYGRRRIKEWRGGGQRRRRSCGGQWER